jgi:hypothetical protein
VGRTKIDLMKVSNKNEWEIDGTARNDPGQKERRSPLKRALSSNRFDLVGKK